MKKVFPIQRIDPDKEVIITLEQLDTLIQMANALLETKSFSEFTQEEHILLMMLDNTVSFRSNELPAQIIPRVKTFRKKIQESAYHQWVAEHMDWIPNKGMGMYIKALNLHFGGSQMHGWHLFKWTE